MPSSVTRSRTSRQPAQNCCDSATPFAALKRWLDLFVDFVITKQGLAAVLQSDDPCFDPLHDYFIARLVPVCADMPKTATKAGQVRADLDAYEILRGVVSICAGNAHIATTTPADWLSSSWPDCASPLRHPTGRSSLTITPGSVTAVMASANQDRPGTPRRPRSTPPVRSCCGIVNQNDSSPFHGPDDRDRVIPG